LLERGTQPCCGEVVPTRLGLLSEMDARVVVQLCEVHPVRYHVHSGSGDRLDSAELGGSVR